MQKFILLLPVFIFTCLSAKPQPQNHEIHKFPAGTFHRYNSTITGLSYGLFSYSDRPRNTKTSGIRLELIGGGFFAAPFEDLLKETDSDYASALREPISEKVKGINISSCGSVGALKISGISVAGVGQGLIRADGFVLSFFYSDVQCLNGLQCSGFTNEVFSMKGVQISVWNKAAGMKGLQVGIFNKAKKTKGVQIGLWNRNERRDWPIINWNFKRR